MKFCNFGTELSMGSRDAEHFNGLKINKKKISKLSIFNVQLNLMVVNETLMLFYSNGNFPENLNRRKKYVGINLLLCLFF